MPRLMEKRDWSRVVSSFGNLDRVWQEDVTGDSGEVSLSLPEVGAFRVYLVKIEEKSESRCSARDLIGYGRKYGGVPRTSEEWLREIREGDAT